MENQKITGFFFEVEGAQVIDVQINLEYTSYRMVEELVKTKTPEESLYLVWKTGGGSPFSQQLCFTQGIEELAQIEVPPRAKFIRTIICELERIYGHFLWFGVIGYEAGLETLMADVSKDHILIMKLLEALLDLKEGHIINVIGGVRQDIRLTPAIINKISTGLGILEDHLALYETRLLDEQKLGRRFQDIGVLKLNKAVELCATGPLARASGLRFDVRRDDAYGAFETIDFDHGRSDYGDVMARIDVILQEAYEATHIVRTALINLPEGEIRIPSPEWINPGEILSRTEAPQGEILHYLRLTSNKVNRLKIRPPSMANLAALLEILKGGSVADIPVVIASVDPYFLGFDQITLKEITTNKTRIYRRSELRKYGIEQYTSEHL